MNFTGHVTKNGIEYDIELSGYSEDELYKEVALWLLRIGYKKPSRFRFLQPKVLRSFPEEILEKMRSTL
jgi:hypothetical protein